MRLPDSVQRTLMTKPSLVLAAVACIAVLGLLIGGLAAVVHSASGSSSRSSSSDSMANGRTPDKATLEEENAWWQSLSTADKWREQNYDSGFVGIYNNGYSDAEIEVWANKVCANVATYQSANAVTDLLYSNNTSSSVTWDMTKQQVGPRCCSTAPRTWSTAGTDGGPLGSTHNDGLVLG